MCEEIASSTEGDSSPPVVNNCYIEYVNRKTGWKEKAETDLVGRGEKTRGRRQVRKLNMELLILLSVVVLEKFIELEP